MTILTAKKIYETSLHAMLTLLPAPQRIEPNDPQVPRGPACIFKLVNSGFLPLSPSYVVVCYIQFFIPTHLPFGDILLFRIPLSCKPLPRLNLPSHILALPGQ